ncbi:MAG: GNAT family N-acetyltransferase [Gammaproteobacteria bacterium]|jgi:ribosomal protein S18 acetylase RimI-like enzyme|nr:GNAT family N-acetyltransferase [Gammaproteobacteria bacterium]
MTDDTCQPLFRHAVAQDLPRLVSMLADDDLGAQREDSSQPLNPRYRTAFNAIDRDPNNALIVAELEQSIVGMLQLTYIPYLTHIGSWRCLIEAVRVDAKYRDRGLGTKLIEWAIEAARKRKCRIIQLTSDKQRPDALRFYAGLGFKATHEGFKLKL